MILVAFDKGYVTVRDSKVVESSSPEAAAAAREALRGPVVRQEAPTTDGLTIIEGRIVKLRRGTEEYDRQALSTLDGVIMDV